MNMYITLNLFFHNYILLLVWLAMWKMKTPVELILDNYVLFSCC